MYRLLGTDGLASIIRAAVWLVGLPVLIFLVKNPAMTGGDRETMLAIGIPLVGTAAQVIGLVASVWLGPWTKTMVARSHLKKVGTHLDQLSNKQEAVPYAAIEFHAQALQALAVERSQLSVVAKMQTALTTIERLKQDGVADVRSIPHGCRNELLDCMGVIPTNRPRRRKNT